MIIRKKAYFLLICIAILSIQVNIVPAAPPPTPSGFGAQLDPSARVYLQWDFVATAESSRIERWNEAGAQWQVVTTLPAAVTQYTDDTVAIDPSDPNEYLYRIASENSDGRSAYVETWAPNCDTMVADPMAAWRANRLANASPVWLQDVPSPGDHSVITLSDPNHPDPATFDERLLLLSNDRYIALFDKLEGALIGLTHRAYGMEFFRQPEGVTPHAWRIYSGTNGMEDTSLLLNPLQSYWEVPLLIQSEDAEGNAVLTFRWNNFRNTGMSVDNEWRLQRTGSEGLHGRMLINGQLTDKSLGEGITRVHFPSLSGLELTAAVNPSMKLIWPNSGWGTAVSSYHVTQLGNLLSPSLSTQFIGYQRDGFALYWAAEDPEHQSKQFRVQNNISSADSYLELYPADGSGVDGNSFAMDFDVVLTPMCGDWTKLAKRYRKFAVQQKWTDWGAGKTIDRSDLPQPLKDGYYWWVVNVGVDNGSQIILDQVNARKGEIDVPMAFHIYNWHEPGFDLGYPEFTPKAGFADVISQIQSDGSPAMPYINVNNADITDRVDPAYPNGHWAEVMPFVKLDPFGNTYDFDPTPADTTDLRTLGTLCSGTQYWQDTVHDLVNSVFTLGSHAIYLDTFAGNYQGCFSTNHDHAYTGYGPWIVQSQQQIIMDAAVIKSLEANRFVTTEHFGDAYMKYIDAVMWYTTPQPDNIPLLAAIYSDYQISVGPRAANLDSLLAFAMKIGRGFVWGSQLGLTSTTQLEPNRAEKLVYLNSLAQARLDLKRFLSYGEYLAPAEDASVTVTADWCMKQTCVTDPIYKTASGPAVLSARWLSPQGEPAIIMTNTDPVNAHTVSIPIPKNWRGLEIQQCTTDDSSCANVSIAAATYPVTLAPLATAYLRFAAADLHLSLSVNNTENLQVGDLIVYTFTLTNQGPSTSSASNITVHLPTGLQYVSSTPSQGSCTVINDLVCSSGQIGINETSIVTVVARILTAGSIDVTASANNMEVDPVQSNNTAAFGLSVLTTSVIPMLSHWGFYALLLMLGGLGYFVISRKATLMLRRPLS